MRILILTLLMLMCSTVEAALFEEPIIVAVMDLGFHEGTSESAFDTLDIGKSAGEYVAMRLVENEHFTVIDKDVISEQLSEANINVTGLIDPKTARHIGEILGVRYIVYGNVADVTLDSKSETQYSENGIPSLHNTETVRATVVLRIMDVESGRILMASKGTGFDDTYSGWAFLIEFGTFKVPQTSVHNALRSAAFKAVDLLVQRLYGSAQKK